MSSPSGAVIGVLIDARRVLEAAALLLQLNAIFAHGSQSTLLPPRRPRRGTAELLRRFEAGLFERGNRSLYNRAGGGVCTDMVASASRVFLAGAAWRL